MERKKMTNNKRVKKQKGNTRRGRKPNNYNKNTNIVVVNASTRKRKTNKGNNAGTNTTITNTLPPHLTLYSDRNPTNENFIQELIAINKQNNSIMSDMKHTAIKESNAIIDKLHEHTFLQSHHNEEFLKKFEEKALLNVEKAKSISENQFNDYIKDNSSNHITPTRTPMKRSTPITSQRNPMMRKSRGNINSFTIKNLGQTAVDRIVKAYGERNKTSLLANEDFRKDWKNDTVRVT